MTDTSAVNLIKWYALHDGRVEEMRKQVGNAFWNYQHTLAEWTIPDEQHQRAAFENLKSGVKTFPCPRCSSKGSLYLDANPIDLTKEDFKTYVWKFHNVVNAKLGKPQFPIEKLNNCVPAEIVEEFASQIDNEILRNKILQTITCEV